MKTIEEAAKEAAVCANCNKKAIFCKLCTPRNRFIEGVAFAQQWIDVKDELPTNQDIVLLKSDKDCYATAYLHDNKDGFILYGDDAYIEFGNITHWRPIELK